MTEEDKVNQPTGGDNGAPVPAPSPKGSGKSSFWFWVLIIILGGGAYSYTQGWLDKPIAMFLGHELTPQQINASTTPTIAAPVEREDVSFETDNADYIAQIEALQIRLSSQESTSRNLQSISEDLADKISRLSGGEARPLATENDLIRMRLELIDLRLILTGDTLAAVRALEGLEDEVEPESSMGLTIADNRQRLSQTPSRSHVLGLIDDLDSHVKKSVADVRERLDNLTAENEKSDQEGGILNVLFKVKKTDSALLREQQLARDLEARIEPAKTALLLRDRDSYLTSIASLQQAADALRNHNATVSTSEISRLLSELISTGFPSAYLLLTNPTS